MKLVYQKYICIFILFIINIVLSTTFIYYANKWYVYIFILVLMSIINSFNSILLLIDKMLYGDINHPRIQPLNYIYVIPCYNESHDELSQSLNSLVNQRTVPGDKRSLLIICDGIVTGKSNIESTDCILKKLLKNNDTPHIHNYTTWDNKINILEVYSGIYNGVDYNLIVKHVNYGKRDSLVLARKLCFNFNNKILDDSMVSNELMHLIGSKFESIYNSNSNIKYIIGIDADTVFDYNCSYELILSIYKDPTIFGCVGLVDISSSMCKLNPLILYQYAEYIFAQCLRRQAQSKITHKVNCLSGCNQILRVSEETCGNEILSKFNYLPKETDNIFDHIRSYASEDRNHVCLMLSLYPYVKTVQTLKAIAYTFVPTSFNVFFSQRRRWSLGANTNDMLLLYLPNINIFEKIGAFVNVLIYSLSPFIFIATIIFIKAIITNPSYLMLLLSIIIIITGIYSLLIPIFILPMTFSKTIYYYFSLAIFFTFGSLINLLIYFNSIFNMDVIKWGKTRSIETFKQSDQSGQYVLNEPINNKVNQNSNLNQEQTDLEYDNDVFYGYNQNITSLENADYIHINTRETDV